MAGLLDFLFTGNDNPQEKYGMLNAGIQLLNASQPVGVGANSYTPGLGAGLAAGLQGYQTGKQQYQTQQLQQFQNQALMDLYGTDANKPNSLSGTPSAAYDGTGKESALDRYTKFTLLAGGHPEKIAEYEANKVVANGMTAKENLQFQQQQLNTQESLELRKQQAEQNNLFRQQQLEQQRALQDQRIQTDADKRQEKKDLERNKAGGALDSVLADYNKQLEQIDALEKAPGLDSIVGMADANLPAFSPTQQNAVNLYDTVVSASMLGGLQNLKNSSSTGASGFGSLTASEGQTIKDAQGALQRSSSEEEFRKNLANYKRIVEESRDRVQSTFDRVYNPQQQGPTGKPPSHPAPPPTGAGASYIDAAKAELARRKAGK